MLMKTKLLTIISMSLLFTGMSFAGQQKGTMKDPRDGQTYKTVKIGEQVWMAENLNYETENSYCYEDDPANCEKYGRLYEWDAALNACPSGWHLPTSEEFRTLISNVGGGETAGKMLKSTTGWYEGGNGIDKYGFNVLPAGFRIICGFNVNVLPAGFRLIDGNFDFAGKNADFWSATEYGEYYAYYLLLYYDFEDAYLFANIVKDNARSVRCLRGSVPQKNEITSQKGIMKDTEIMKDTRDGQTYKTVKIGRQVWMAENLNYDIKHSYCYNDSTENCKKYGRFYTWEAALNACPEGWHLPTKGGFETLRFNVGGSDVAGKMLKSTTGWYDDGNGVDKYGFNVLPAGTRYYDGVFYDAGKYANFWSASEIDENYAYDLDLGYRDESADLLNYDKDYANSVRCLRGSN